MSDINASTTQLNFRMTKHETVDYRRLGTVLVSSVSDRQNQNVTTAMPAANYLLCAVIVVLSLSQAAWSQSESAQRSPPAATEVRELVRELLKTTSTEERNTLLAARKELLTIALRRALIMQGNGLLVAGKYSEALDIYTLAHSIAGQINDREGLASASLNIGTVNYFQGNHAVALERYQQARALFISVGNQAESAKALSGLALIYKEQRKDREALNAYQQVFKEFEALADKEEMANALSGMGGIYYARGDYAAASRAFLKSLEANGTSENVLRVADAFYMQGDYAEAAEYYQKSLPEFERQQNPGGIISALGGAANSHYYLGDYDEALKYYRRNVTVQQALNDWAGVATSLQGMGNSHRVRGDFGSALESYLASLTAADRSNNKISTAATLSSIGLVRALQGDPQQALDYYGKSLVLFESTGDKVGMARMLAQTGNAYYTIGNYDSAIEAYRKSLALRLAMDDKSSQANLLVGLGTVYLTQSNYSEAIESYQQAHALFESLRNKEAAADVLASIANAFLQQGDFTQALDSAERAVALARQEENLSTVWYARTIAGKTQRRLHQPTLAGQSFAEAIAIVESLRSQPSSAETRAGRNSLLPYHAAVELALEQDRTADAFDYAERGKVQMLSELLGQSNAKITRSMTDDEQTRERKLIAELISLDLRLEREGHTHGRDGVRIAALKNRRHRARVAYDQFRKKLYASHSRLRVDRGELLPLKVQETRSLINDRQTAMLEYVVTEDKIYLFVITAAPGAGRSSGGDGRKKAGESLVTAKAFRLNIDSSELAKHTARLLQLLDSRDESYGQLARELYDLLVKPAQEQLAGKSRLVIVPDGILWRLPFEALQPADDRYLLDEASISYVPSLTALREMRKLTRKASSGRLRPWSLSAFGSPLLSKELEQRVAMNYVTRPLDVVETATRFPAAGAEIERLKLVYGKGQSLVFVGPDASEARAKAAVGRPGVLHFAARALLNDASPMYSFIALAGGGTSPQDEGLLQLGEIVNLRSRASLVVLSGASMTQERLGAGNAAIGHAWSWFVAGTPTTVVRRWEVKGPGATQLMAEFHTNVKKVSGPGYSKAEALRQSALSLRRSSDYQHPYFWSGFALLGDSR